MAAALIERIEIDANQNITIQFRYRDEYIALLDYVEGRKTP
jgi:hypothetical protein